MRNAIFLVCASCFLECMSCVWVSKNQLQLEYDKAEVVVKEMLGPELPQASVTVYEMFGIKIPSYADDLFAGMPVEPLFGKYDEVDTTDAETVLMSVSSYNSEVRQTDNTPFETACGIVGVGIVATNFFAKGTFVVIEGFPEMIFVCGDRMNKRYNNKPYLDIWGPSRDKSEIFGRQNLRVSALKTSHAKNSMLAQTYKAREAALKKFSPGSMSELVEAIKAVGGKQINVASNTFTHLKTSTLRG